MSKFNIATTIPLDAQLTTTESPRWEFEYGDKNDPSGYDCNMKCMQCIAKRGGRRCKRTSCYTIPYCWQHLKNLAYLRIGRTTLVDPQTNQRFKFLGLFACDPKRPGGTVFRTRDAITPYVGDIKTMEEIDDTYRGENETVPYGELVEAGAGQEDFVVDGACFRGVASLANDAIPGSTCDGARCRTNSKFYSGDGNYPTLMATKPIKDGDEIFVSYGEEYWGGEHKPHRTKPRHVYEKIEYKCK
jgi:hypothetical protein